MLLLLLNVILMFSHFLLFVDEFSFRSSSNSSMSKPRRKYNKHQDGLCLLNAH